MKKTDRRKSKFRTSARSKTTASCARRLPSSMKNPHMGCVLRRLPTETHAQEEPDIVVACSHEPDYVYSLRKIGIDVIYRLPSYHGRDGCPCQFRFYYLPESERAHGKGATQDSVQRCQNDVKKLSASVATESTLIQLYDEKQVKEILPQMAANVQFLSSDRAKKDQVHELCRTLVVSLSKGRQ
jgi:hypothetical protein